MFSIDESKFEKALADSESFCIKQGLKRGHMAMMAEPSQAEPDIESLLDAKMEAEPPGPSGWRSKSRRMSFGNHHAGDGLMKADDLTPENFRDNVLSHTWRLLDKFGGPTECRQKLRRTMATRPRWRRQKPPALRSNLTPTRKGGKRKQTATRVS